MFKNNGTCCISQCNASSTVNVKDILVKNNMALELVILLPPRLLPLTEGYSACHGSKLTLYYWAFPKLLIYLWDVHHSIPLVDPL